jgi:hypothetical protein
MTGARSIATKLSSADRIELAIDLIEENIERAPGYAFDLASSLIQTVCRTILKECGKDPGKNPDVHSLAKATLDAVLFVPDGHPDPTAAKRHLDAAFRNLTGVVLGVGTLRNMEGDVSHGKELERVGLAPCHAEFAVRSADAVVKFLFECHRSAKLPGTQEGALAYSENPSFNEYVDDLHQPVQILAGQYKPSEVLFQMDRQSYQDALTEYLLESKVEEQ